MASTRSGGSGAPLTVRSAWPGEAGLVLSFVRELADYEKLAHEVTASEEQIDRALFGPMPHAFCDIAEWDNQPAGFAFWSYRFSTFSGHDGLYLEDLFVRPEFRGKGLGKALLARLARRCVEEGLVRLEWAVLDWNTPSIDFYKSLGAEAMDDWTAFRMAGTALEQLAETAAER